MADHMGEAYLRYSFTKGTEQEVSFLVDALGLEPGMRVLDVGCGPGRHAHELANRGIEVHGVDISQAFVDLAQAGAPDGATFARGDARALGFDTEFDAAISLCQGGFGLAAMPGGPVPSLDPDGEVLSGMARAVVPGGRVAVSAFSAPIWASTALASAMDEATPEGSPRCRPICAAAAFISPLSPPPPAKAPVRRSTTNGQLEKIIG